MKIRRCTKELVCLVCVFVLLFCTACSNEAPKKETEPKKLTLWYSDEGMQEYLESAARTFELNHEVSIKCEYHDAKSYLEDIYDASMNGEQMPDVYLLRHDKLGRACMEGLAAVNTSDMYSETNYCKTALLSAQYQGKLMAYPLCYDTVCMVYNTQSFPKAPVSMGAITAFSQTGEIGEGVQNILYWNINDYFSDVPFVEAYMDIGGECGDDDTVLSIVNNEMGDCLLQFYALSQFFAIDSTNTNKDDVPMAFVEGRALCVFADTGMLKTIDWYDTQGMDIAYDICAVPEIDEWHQCRSGSYTKLAVVNGFSLQQQEAAQFAQYLTYDYVNELYEMAGCFSARRGVFYDNAKFSELYKIYEQSKQFPKLPQTEDLQINLELLFDNVGSGADVMTELIGFSQKMELRMHKEAS